MTIPVVKDGSRAIVDAAVNAINETMSWELKPDDESAIYGILRTVYAAGYSAGWDENQTLDELVQEPQLEEEPN